MTASVKIFSFSGVVSVPVANQNLQSSDDAFVLLKQPYLNRETLSATGTAAASSTATAPANTACLLVEVESGKTIAYEVTPQAADLRVADTNSPTLTGRNTINFGPNYRLSVVEIT